MGRSERLAAYIAMIDEFLSGRLAVEQFASGFFLAFQRDPGGWEGDLFEVLNWIQTSCECYTPSTPRTEFDLTEEQLRAEVAESQEELRRLQSSVQD